MAYSFCQNHLVELYRAVENENILQIEKIEHELSKKEECVACTYALRAKGDVRRVLLSFLQDEGFTVAGGKSNSEVERFAWWFVHLIILVPTFVAFFIPLKLVLGSQMAVLFASVSTAVVFAVFSKLFD